MSIYDGLEYCHRTGVVRRVWKTSKHQRLGPIGCRDSGRGLLKCSLGFLHLLVYAWQVGPVPVGYTVRHINGCRQDNRLENLEIVPHLKRNIAWQSMSKRDRRRDSTQGRPKLPRYLVRVGDIVYTAARDEGWTKGLALEVTDLCRNGVSARANFANGEWAPVYIDRQDIGRVVSMRRKTEAIAC